MKENNNNIYLSYYLNKLILKKGKLSKAESLISKVNLLLIKNLKKDPMLILDIAVQNIMPIFLLSNKKLGKRIIVRPLFILSPFSRRLVGLKWLVESSLKKQGSFFKNFVIEVTEAFENKGSLKKKQQDLNSIVLENRSNLRYRW